MISPADAAPAWIPFLDARLQAAVRAVTGTEDLAHDPLRGLYISDDQALSLASGRGPDAADARLARATELLGLDALDAAVLAVCIAPELHPRYGRLYAYLQDDITRRLASQRLVAALLSDQGVSEADVLHCFADQARLPRLGAIRTLSPDPAVAFADRGIKVADRLAAFVLGAQPEMVPSASPSPLRRVRAATGGCGRAEAVTEVKGLLGADTHLPLLVVGPDAAEVLAAATETPLLLVDVRDLEHPETIADATLAAGLEQAHVCLDGLEDLSPQQRARLSAHLDHQTQRTILIGRTSRDTQALGDRTVMTVEVPFPSFRERRMTWEQTTGAPDASEVAAKFRLSLDQIRAGAEVSRIAARHQGQGVPGPTELDLGARHASSSRLGELAVRLAPGYRWSDLVLPERQLELLSSISSYLRHRDRVLAEWGYERTVARTQGLKVLFAGESGTGKTMAAQVLAAALGLELFRVDLATVVSKYIGETEKNLERIFTAADGSNAILFFDEADALFGKRSEVSDSHDRYANIEVAYLLQRMEQYPGAVILATNFRRNIDDAFVRRLDFVVDFPFPEAEDRRRIWRLVVPAEAPVADDADFDFLAGQFKLSGGAIRNCSLSAAFAAADEDSPIAMRHLVRAVAQEYSKQGRLTLEADFERFHELIRAGRDSR